MPRSWIHEVLSPPSLYAFTTRYLCARVTLPSKFRRLYFHVIVTYTRTQVKIHSLSNFADCIFWPTFGMKKGFVYECIFVLHRIDLIVMSISALTWQYWGKPQINTAVLCFVWNTNSDVAYYNFDVFKSLSREWHACLTLITFQPLASISWNMIQISYS